MSYVAAPSRRRPAVDLSEVTASHILVFRTDYSDEPSWQLVAAALKQSWPNPDCEMAWHFV